MQYAVKEIGVDEDSLKELVVFFKDVFPKTDRFTLDFIRWQYAQNPLGHIVGFNAWDNGRIISHFAGLPIEMNLFGEIRKGLLCINVSTNADYRGKKLFTTLGNATIHSASENGFDFMIAVPNANSTHAFLKYFGFYLISSLTVKVGFGENIYSDKQFKCFKIWDDNQWKWRLNNPMSRYSYNKTGIVSSPLSFFAKTISKSLLSENIQESLLNSSEIRPLNLYVGLGADTSKGLYFNMPSFVKRPPFNLVFRDLTGGKIPEVNKENIFLQLIDLDTI